MKRFTLTRESYENVKCALLKVSDCREAFYTHKRILWKCEMCSAKSQWLSWSVLHTRESYEMSRPCYNDARGCMSGGWVLLHWPQESVRSFDGFHLMGVSCPVRTWCAQQYLMCTAILDMHDSTWYARQYLRCTALSDMHGSTWYAWQ